MNPRAILGHLVGGGGGNGGQDLSVLDSDLVSSFLDIDWRASSWHSEPASAEVWQGMMAGHIPQSTVTAWALNGVPHKSRKRIQLEFFFLSMEYAMGYGALRRMARTQIDNAARFITLLVGGNTDGIFSAVMDTPVLALSHRPKP